MSSAFKDLGRRRAMARASPNRAWRKKSGVIPRRAQIGPSLEYTALTSDFATYLSVVSVLSASVPPSPDTAGVVSFLASPQPVTAKNENISIAHKHNRVTVFI